MTTSSIELMQKKTENKMVFYELEARELLKEISDLPQEEAVRLVDNFIEAKIEGAIESVEDRRYIPEFIEENDYQL